MQNNKVLWIGGILVIAFLVWIFTANSGPGPYDTFASCLKDKGALFYGAFWCPNCANQKAKFGRSAKFVPYVECSTPDGQGQLQDCKDKGITNYPTWDFPPLGEATTTTRLIGDLPLEQLAEETGCILPATQ